MSSVTERRHANGSWTIDLREDAPLEIRSQLHLTARGATTKGFALCVVTDRPVDLDRLIPPADPVATPHPLLQVARWAGVLTSTDDRRRSLAGEGLLALLEDSTGAGVMVTELADVRAKASASSLVTALVGSGSLPKSWPSGGGTVGLSGSPLRVGDIHSCSASLQIGDHVASVRWHLLDVSWRAGRRSIRVRPTGHVDWGTRAEVYGAWPRVVLGNRLPSVDDDRWITVRTAGSWAESAAGYADQAVADGINANGGPLGPKLSPNPLTSNGYWSAIKRLPLPRQVEVPFDQDETLAQWQTRTIEVLDEGTNTSTVSAPTLTGIVSDGARLEPGEALWIWDPEMGLYDSTGPSITYGGQTLYPVRTNLVSTTWPVTAGMGVYLLWVERTSVGAAQRVLDLTDHVAFSDDPATQLEIGLPAPSL